MLDIDHIRTQLNELPFKGGKREVFVGRISEMFDKESEQSIADQFAHFENELRSYTLILTRRGDDQDALFVVQKLRTLALDLSGIAKGINWVAKITNIAMEMVLLGLAGLWLDNQLETRFLGLLGFAWGLPLGVWHLIVMTKGEGTVGTATDSGHGDRTS